MSTKLILPINVLCQLAGLFVFITYPDFRLFAVFIPLSVAFNSIRSTRVRNTYISLFVIVWMLLFQYESIRTFYLNQNFKKDFPKTRFLFPPAGWIMFYNVGNSAGYIEVFGFKDGVPQFIDPHDIFETRTIGYDNIHRGILGAVSDRNPQKAMQFCRFLNYKFPYFDKFYVAASYHPDLVKERFERRQRILYQCDENQIKFMK